MTRGWMPALRIARREARKAKGRSSLVLAMIGLPVALLAFAAVLFDMFSLTTQERLDRRLGTSDAYIRWYSTDELTQLPDGSDYGTVARPGTSPVGGSAQEKSPTEADLLALLPPGTRVLPMEESSIKVRTPNGIGDLGTMAGVASDPMLRGMFHLLRGRAATAGDEVLINASAAERLGVGVGGTISAIGPDRVYKVTGLVEYADRLLPTVVLPKGSGEGGIWLVDTPAPIDWAQVQRLNKSGMLVISREVVLNPPGDMPTGNNPGEMRPEEMVVGVIVAGLALLEIVLLAGPAFAVGARRRSRELALVAAAGGEPKQLRRIVLADGVVLGAVGAVAGLALGIVAALIARPFIEENLAYSRAGGYRFFPLALLGIAGLAVITGMLAALVPAFTAARQPVVLALAGRRGILRSRKRWIFLGVALAAAGSAIAAYGAVEFDETTMLAGLVLAELGLVLVTPALVGLVARLGRWLPLAPRLALRDTARNRASAAPAISAVMAAVAGAVAAGIFFAGDQRQAEAMYDPSLPMGHMVVQHYADPGMPQLNWAEAESKVRSVLPEARIHRYMSAETFSPVIPPERECPLFVPDRQTTEQEREAARTDARCNHMYNNTVAGVVVSDGDTLAAFTGADAGRIAEAREVLARGGAVTTDDRLVKDGRITLRTYGGDKPDVTVEGHYLGDYPGFVVMLSPKAEGTGTLITGLVVATTGPPTQAQEERLNLLMAQLDSDVHIAVERGPDDSRSLAALGIAAVAALIALGAAGIATGLAAADSRADLGTLASVGAAPRVRRRLSLSQAGVISGLGALLGAVAGLGAAAVLITALNNFQSRMSVPYSPIPFVIPWDVAAMIIAVPLLAMAGAGLLTRSRLPIERRL